MTITSCICVPVGASDETIAWERGVPVLVHFAHHGAGDWIQINNAHTQEIVAAGGPLTHFSVWKASDALFFVRIPLQSGIERTFALRCQSPSAGASLNSYLRRLQETGQQKAAAGNHFGRKTDDGSAALYFHYYGMLQHQQNMLQDYVRTGAYFSAITDNPTDFAGKTIMDVGAGSGILSLFAAEAGAKRVYAVEASQMAKYAEQLKNANPALGSRITVLQSKVEELQLAEKVDILVSEPMGTLLVNERMLETYLYARDHFLKPGGRMFPQLGRVHAAGFCDEVLHAEIGHKAAFWTIQNYYGVNLQALHGPATHGYYSQVVVDAFDPSILATDFHTKEFDFATVKEEELHSIVMPLRLTVTSAAATRIHGLACWFDVMFDGSNTGPMWLSTAPGQPTTHWFQLRCVLAEPLQVWPGCVLTGECRLEAHNRQSYDIFLTLCAPPLHPGGPAQKGTGKFDLKDPYYRQLNMWPAAQPQAEGVESGWVPAEAPANGTQQWPSHDPAGQWGV